MSSHPPTPRIVTLLSEGAPLDDLKAAAARLWLDYGGRTLDSDGKMGAVVDAYWHSRPGRDPYWNFLASRGACAECGEGYKLENLAICPNCFNTYCPRESRVCDCGFETLG